MILSVLIRFPIVSTSLLFNKDLNIATKYRCYLQICKLSSLPYLIEDKHFYKIGLSFYSDGKCLFCIKSDNHEKNTCSSVVNRFNLWNVLFSIPKTHLN